MELDRDWQELFKSKNLDVVLVQEANEDDIEELFSRLNNGEPLNAAEKRNAIGGDMCELIRQIAGDGFFKNNIRFGNDRYQHLEVAAKFLLIESNELNGGGSFTDLKKRFLDKLVKDNKVMSETGRAGLRRRVGEQLRLMARVFGAADPLLAKQTYPPLYYFFIKQAIRYYAHPSLHGKMHDFLEKFHIRRQENLAKPEDGRDPSLMEFDRLMQQATNDLGSLQTRASLLFRYSLQEHPDVEVRDKNRSSTEEERLAIWILGGKQCAQCSKRLEDLSEMQSDHIVQWSWGGPTSLENARSLCITCNEAMATKIS